MQKKVSKRDHKLDKENQESSLEPAGCLRPSFCPPEILPFTLPVAPTADLVGDTGGVVPWEVLAGVHEGLTDAVSAPSGRTTLLVFRDHLAVAVDDRIVSEHAEAGQAIVAAQWAPTIRDSGA